MPDEGTFFFVKMGKNRLLFLFHGIAMRVRTRDRGDDTHEECQKSERSEREELIASAVIHDEKR